MSFNEIGLSPEVVRGTRAMGFVEPTPIQLRAFPIILAGRDLIGTAQTGRGKTAAFALPILTLLAKHGAFRYSHVARPHLTAYCERSVYKNALDDRGRTIFGGLIRVEPHVPVSKVRNLLLSNDAEANSMPGLEILADNVRCTHGATSGQIDEDELFYLRTLGVPVPVAQRLIVSCFLDEVIQRLDHPAMAEYLHRLSGEKFAKSRG